MRRQAPPGGGMRVLFLAVILAAQAPCLYGAESSSAQFLSLGFGARALGMGEAFTAVADDISCVYYNPAGLAEQASGTTWKSGPAGPAGDEVQFSHAWHVQDTALSQLSYMARPYIYSATYFSAGKIEGRNADQSLSGDFTAQDLALGVSRGFMLGPVMAGITGKIISQRIKTSGAASFAADLGLLYRFEGSPYSVGASLANLGTKVKFEDESFPLPLRLRAGAAAAFK
ncbi:MAG: hypothetical protein COT18_09720, partial [Elusimicrobia bacterium CG08_land_8_20_14_0_20_59_10]